MRYKIFKGFKNKRLIIIIWVIAILAFISYRLFSYADDRYTKPARCEQRDMLSSTRLSSEDEFPFMFQGEPLLTKSRPESLRNRYSPSLNRFPNVMACLKGAEKGKLAPNLANFGWEKMHSLEDVDVCLYRVFSSLGNSQGSIDWLKGQGFEVINIRPDSEGAKVEAHFYPTTCGVRFADDWTLVNYILLGDPGYKHLGVVVMFDNDDEVGGVEMGYITK